MKNKRLIIVFSAIGLLLLLIFSLSVGRYNVPISSILKMILGENDSSTSLIVVNLRLPRTIAAILIGAALSTSGAAYQGLFQNPLVSPDILGVSSGACVGAIISILLGLNKTWTMTLAFIMGIISVSSAIILSVITKQNKNIVLVFSGVIIGRFMSSIVGILIFYADDESQLGAIMDWEMGSLAKVSGSELVVFAPLLLICIVLLFSLRWRINLLSVGEEEAKALGVNINRERTLVIVLATFATAISVCIAGTIAWIGLIVPHVCRWLIKDDNRYGIPLNIILGGAALLVSDILARTLLPYELPLEVITGLVGAPVFALIMVRRWKK